MERSEHKLHARTYPDECAKITGAKATSPAGDGTEF
jgi:hypothetical protein